MGRTLWILLFLTGAALSAAFLLRLRFRLRHRAIHRADGDGWERGRPALAGLALSLLAAGMGLGGAVAWSPPSVFRGEMPWASLVEIGPEPLPDEVVAEPVVSQPGPEAIAEAGEVEPTPEESSPSPAPGEETDTQDTEASPPTAVSPAAPDEALQADTSPVTAPSADLRYGVRVGVFRSRRNAEEVVAALREAGFAPLVAQRATSDGAPLHYVYAGAFETRDRAETAAASVRTLGLEVLVVEMAAVPQG